MSQELSVNISQAQLWPQGDIRDPLGVWGARLAVTGDVSLGSLTVDFTVPQAQRAAYVYTCYSAQTIVLVSATAVIMNGICRLLTNWPNIDPTAGVQGFGTAEFRAVGIGGFSAAPEGGQTEPYIAPADRFILLYDPRPGIAGDLSIVQLKTTVSIENDTYSFECYGYYWDRSVMDAPGGPRHPGSS